MKSLTAKTKVPQPTTKDASHMSARGGTTKGRLFLGFIDQGIVSASGLLTFVIAAQFLSPTELGHYSFGLATCLLIISLSRAICGEPLLVRSVGPHQGRPSIARDTRAMLGLTVVIALVSTVLCSLIGIGSFLIGPSNDGFSGTFIASAVAAPGLVLQDSLRYCFIAQKKTRALVLNDTLTLVTGATAITMSGVLMKDSSAMLSAWGLASLVVGLVTLIFTATLPSFKNSGPWLKATWRSSSAYFTENAMGALAGYTIVVILAVFVAPAEVAAYRATLIVYGVANLVINFMRTQILRELRPSMLDTVRGLSRTSGKLVLPVVLTIVAMLVALLLMPQQLGELLLQDTWLLVAALLIPGALNRLAAGLSIVPTITLRIQGVAWRATVIKMVILVISLVLGPIGALYWGAAGALLADTFCYALTAILLFVLSVRQSKGNHISK
jgi:O-antigen/teichoic acid export membrane protein